MSELSRPASIRELANELPRATLVYLCELRGLPVSRANDDCRSSIARSFRGQREEFLSMLRKEDLLILLSLPLRDGNQVFELPNPTRFSKRELLEHAMDGFGRTTRTLGEPFVLRRVEYRTPLPPSKAAAPTPPEAPLENSDAWSRARSVRSLFAQVGLAVPQVVGQDEFGALIEALELRGFEVATASGVRITPLHDALSLDAELRIRHDPIAGPFSMRANQVVSPDMPAFDGGNDYERAALRLELLTAAGGEWSEEHRERSLSIATMGLPLEAKECELLRFLADAMAKASRDPMVVLTSLARRLESSDGDALLRDFNEIRDPGPETYTLLCDHWSALAKR